MKHILLIAGILLAFSACKKEEKEVAQMVSLQVDTTAILKYTADFKGSADVTTSGTAEVYLKNQKYNLKLVNFKTNAGPDLHVLLSKEEMPVNYIDLGTLQKLKGDQAYAIQGMPNFSDYSFICIHCIQYNHLFGTAKIN